MDLIPEERPSDSPLVERIWRTTEPSATQGTFLSMAEVHSSLVVTKYQGKLTLTVRGPETKATPAYAPAGAEHFGIMFKPGAFMPEMPPSRVMDRSDVNLPDAASQSFWLHGRAWEFPNFENADTFVNWLVRDKLLVYDPLVSAVLEGQPMNMSLRTIQRRMLQATGLTHNTFYQIRRARNALTLLKQGMSILDVVEQAGYSDQPHLTRILKQMTGQTPAQIVSETRREKLSFLFKTLPF